MAGETILHISYDAVLQELRESVLERHGYHVVSVTGNEAGQRLANSAADLVIVGNGGSFEERMEMVKWLVQNLPQVPVVVMSTSEEELYPSPVVVFLGNTPTELAATVQRALVSHKRTRQR